jgi:KUP system potassium uptake protein
VAGVARPRPPPASRPGTRENAGALTTKARERTSIGAGAALTIGALGVVFGDIGTSPLYSVQTVFLRDADRPVPIEPDAIYGVISLVFWAITLIVTIKYVALIMRADNDGEGGIMALIALLMRLRVARGRRRIFAALAALGIFGAALFFGDSIITPAISVLSAVEGLEIVEPSLHELVVPISAAILIVLFMAQRLGTGVVGRLFGPVMALWFGTLAAFGLNEIVRHPEVVKALSPVWGARFFADDGLTAFLALGGVVLAITGAEALYADMGHFGRAPIRRAWFFLVFPALTINYLGQAALLVHTPAAASNPFYLLIPHWARLPMVFLATAATIIASQAVISGAFSVTRQAVRLGYLPRLRVEHTSLHEGQIYVPFVNWALLVAVLVVVFAFEKSTKLASAYGIAVTGTITITGLLFFVVARVRWNWPLWLVVAAASFFGIIDLAFLGANLTKVLTGGWLPLLVAAAISTVLFTWQKGRGMVTRKREKLEGPLKKFVAQLHESDPPVHRVPGTAVFLNRGDRTTPLAMRANVEFNHTLHEHVIVLSIETEPVPYVSDRRRLKLSDLGFSDDGISHVTARFGFQETPNVPAVLLEAEERGGLERPLDIAQASYFVSKLDLVIGDSRGLSPWRKRLFLATAGLAADPVEYFRLPRDRTVLLGSACEV